MLEKFDKKDAQKLDYEFTGRFTTEMRNSHTGHSVLAGQPTPGREAKGANLEKETPAESMQMNGAFFSDRGGLPTCGLFLYMGQG